MNNVVALTDSRTAVTDSIRAEIAALESRLLLNMADADRTADRLEIELRVATELPSLDTHAFAAAQRQRLGALSHERKRVVAELTSLRQRLSGTLLPG